MNKNNHRPIVVIPMGDPAGIGPEITVKALLTEEINEKARCIITGDAVQIKNTLNLLHQNAEIKILEDPKDGDYRTGILNIIDLHNVDPNSFEYGKISAMCGKAAYEYIEKAIDMVMHQQGDVVATTCINKESLRAANVPYIGHTEIFGALTHTGDPLTMFELENMRVLFLSRHVSLRKACDLVTKERIMEYVKRGTAALKQLGLENPRIAVAGLNPHCGEHGLFGDEEVKEIIPAVEELKNMGYNVEGPIGADSVFYQARMGKYACVLSLYHDQGHIATKTVDFNRTISITCGMPILRTSVDHGTAFDIAGKGIAQDISMKEAIFKAVRYANAYNVENS